jgi:hypothetical protein
MRWIALQTIKVKETDMYIVNKEMILEVMRLRIPHRGNEMMKRNPSILYPTKCNSWIYGVHYFFELSS